MGEEEFLATLPSMERMWRIMTDRHDAATYATLMLWVTGFLLEGEDESILERLVLHLVPLAFDK